MRKKTEKLLGEAIDAPLDFDAIRIVLQDRIEQCRDINENLLRKLEGRVGQEVRIEKTVDRLHDLNTNLARAFMDEHIAEISYWIDRKKDEMSLADLRDYLQTDWMTDLGFTKKYGDDLPITRVLIGEDRLTAQKLLETSADWLVSYYSEKIEDLFHASVDVMMQEQSAFDEGIYEYALTDVPNTSSPSS